MDEMFITNKNYTVSEMCDQHDTAVITEKKVDVTNIGTFVKGEHKSSVVAFQIDRYYDGIDLSEKKIKIIYKTTSGVFESDDLDICNVKYSNKTLKFSWILSNSVTQTTKCMAYICFISDDYLLKTESFMIQVKESFSPTDSSTPSQNWFVVIEGKLEKIEKSIADNQVYEWAKQPTKPSYTYEEVGAEKAGTSDGIFRSAIKYVDGEISRLENVIIPDRENIINNKIIDLDSKKSNTGHVHITSDITDFPEKLPASDVYDWAKEPEKPRYTYDEVGALPDTTHIPSKLSEFEEDNEHTVVTNEERQKWNNKSDFSGSYNDLSNIPEIKQLTDELKEKYDTADQRSRDNENNIKTKLDRAGYSHFQWLQTDENGNIIASEKPKYTPDEVGASSVDHNHDLQYANKNTEHTHQNKQIIDSITQELINNWSNKSTLSVEISDDGILKFKD